MKATGTRTGQEETLSAEHKQVECVCVSFLWGPSRRVFVVVAESEHVSLWWFKVYVMLKVVGAGLTSFMGGVRFLIVWVGGVSVPHSMCARMGMNSENGGFGMFLFGCVLFCKKHDSKVEASKEGTGRA